MIKQSGDGTATVSVIGAGSWGTTLANLLAEKGIALKLWSRNKEVAEAIRKRKENTLYLPGIRLSSRLQATTALQDCGGADIIVIAVPTPYFRETSQKLAGCSLKTGCIAVSAAKGLEEGTYKTMTQAIAEEFPRHTKICALSGPNIAEEVIRNIPTATVIGGKDKASLERVKHVFETSSFKVYTHDDVIGVEVCGAVKNITALAIGICDALHLGDNAKGAIITLGLTEMAKVGRIFGAKRATCYGLAGVGDLVATCSSRFSRNRLVGEMLGQGKNLEEIQKTMHGMIAEGIKTAKAIHSLSLKHKIDLPLTREVFSVFYERKPIKEAISDLLRVI